jgi:hypothetical protein
MVVQYLFGTLSLERPVLFLFYPFAPSARVAGTAEPICKFSYLRRLQQLAQLERDVLSILPNGLGAVLATPLQFGIEPPGCL